MKKNMYVRLAVMALLSFGAMYVLMYVMVDRTGDIYPNLNQLYMAGLTTLPMVVFELLLMKDMYGNKKLNAFLLGGSIFLALLFFVGIREQTFITDKAFLHSMIPHHSSAILMCQQATVFDPEIKTLCVDIIENQQKEIDQMKDILERIK